MDTNTIFFIGSNQNGTKFKTLLIPAFVVYIYIYIYFFFWSHSFHDWPSHWMFCNLHIDLPSPLPKEKNTLKKKVKNNHKKRRKIKNERKVGFTILPPLKATPYFRLTNTNQIANHHRFQLSASNAFCFHWARYIIGFGECVSLGPFILGKFL